MPAVKKRIYRGDDKKSYKGTYRKPPDEGFAYGLNGFRAGSREEGYGEHPEDCRKAGHQNGTQTGAARFKAGFPDREAPRP